jgi:hypothetical protein
MVAPPRDLTAGHSLFAPSPKGARARLFNLCRTLPSCFSGTCCAPLPKSKQETARRRPLRSPLRGYQAAPRVALFRFRQCAMKPTNPLNSTIAKHSA